MRREGRIYKTERCSFEDLELTLNKNSKQGWELWAFMPDPVDRHDDVWYTVLWWMPEIRHHELMRKGDDHDKG